VAAKVTKAGGFAESLLKLLFQGQAYPLIADIPAANLANLQISLHTANPGASGDQNTNEVAYTGYARVAVPRSTGGFTVVANQVNPNANITFPQCTGGSVVASWFGIGDSTTGPGHLWYWGQISPAINISAGVIPQLTIATTISET